MAYKKLKKSERHINRDEGMFQLQHAVVYQCLRDIRGRLNREKYWIEVWAALEDFAPCYHMTRGEMIIRAAHSGFLDFPLEEMKSRGVFETQWEVDVYESGCSI